MIYYHSFKKMHLHFRKANNSDFTALLPFAKKTFKTAYEHLNDPIEFQAYMEKAFHPENFKSEIDNPKSEFWLTENKGELIGYFKINYAGAQTDLNDEKGLEIERIYVSQNWQGKGIGKLMIEKVGEIAKSKNIKYIWLGVWDQNPKAVKFYEREGFKKFGTHIFTIGSVDQADYMMRKYL